MPVIEGHSFMFTRACLICLGVIFAVAGTAASAGDHSCGGLRFLPCVPQPPLEEPACGDTCRQLEKQIAQGCTTAQDAPYADTIFLRRGITIEASDEVRARLSIAALAETPATAVEIVSDLLDDDRDMVRYAAGLQVALSAQRSGMIMSSAATRALDVMRSADTLSFPTSDLLFFQALRAETAGDVRAAIALAAEAGAIEPRFFNAHAVALRLRLLSEEPLTNGRSSNSSQICRQEFEGLLHSLSHIAELEPCPRIAAHLETYLARQLPDPASSPGYTAAQVYLAVLSRRRDLAANRIAHFQDYSRLPCRDSVTRDLTSLANLLGGAR